MDGISHPAFRHEFGQALGQRRIGTLFAMAIKRDGKEFRHRV